MFDFLNNLFSGKKKNESAVTNDMRQQYVSNADSVFLCYSFNDVDFIAQFLKDMDNEGIRVKTQMDEMPLIGIKSRLIWVMKTPTNKCNACRKPS